MDMSRPATLRLARSARLLHRCSPTVRLLHTTTTRYDVSPGTTASAAPTSRNTESSGFWKEWSSSAAFQAALTTVVGLGMVFTAGIGYLEWYKGHVLHRMSRAFEPGYDPALEMHIEDSMHIQRKEQPLVDSIMRGEHACTYFLMIGPNGTGKGTLILNAMRKIQAEGAALCEGHPDLEVFRLRLGKALNFEYFEDWQGSLFSRADPRSAGPALDVERALNKLEKVALRYKRKKGRPIVLAFNDVHLIPNTPEGRALLHQLQQRAEAWAEGGICTMIFSMDDFWCLDVMKKNSSRMEVISVEDLGKGETISTLRRLRLNALARKLPGVEREALPVESEAVLSRVYETVGGRMSHLGKVVRADDLLTESQAMVDREVEWLQSRIGLIPDHDDDVMDEQKWSSCSWLLLSHLARYGSVSYRDARRIMTRTDFIDPLDVSQIISIDRNHQIRLDSTLTLRAVQKAIAEFGFGSKLQATRDRIDEIEGLHRQHELLLKEPVRVTFEGDGKSGTYRLVGLGKTS